LTDGSTQNEPDAEAPNDRQSCESGEPHVYFGGRDLQIRARTRVTVCNGLCSLRVAKEKCSKSVLQKESRAIPGARVRFTRWGPAGPARTSQEPRAVCYH
jgi:hypothetical protein